MAGPLALGPRARTLSFERGGASTAVHVGGSAVALLASATASCQKPKSKLKLFLLRHFDFTPPASAKADDKLDSACSECGMLSFQDLRSCARAPTRIQSPQFSVALEPCAFEGYLEGLSACVGSTMDATYTNSRGFTCHAGLAKERAAPSPIPGGSHLHKFRQPHLNAGPFNPPLGSGKPYNFVT